MEENKEMNTEDLNCKVISEVEKVIGQIVGNSLQVENVDLLGKLVDIHKDISNEKYWKVKEDKIMYYRDDYRDDMYRGGRSRDSRGRYTERGYDKRYRGEEMIDHMQRDYRNYNEGREEYNRGNYGAKGETLESLEYMMQSVVDFVDMLQKDANSQEEIETIKKYTRKISEM
jgi:hypothetical protein